MDDADRAQCLEELQRETALAARAMATPEKARTQDGARVCLDCDEKIEPPRLAANPQATRCTQCQQRHERKR